MTATKKLTMTALQQQDVHVPIWVNNTTKGANRGIVFFTVPNPMGTKEDAVEVPLTWVPIELTAMVTRKQLLESSSLRRALQAGLLELVTDEDAQATLASPSAMKEAEKVRRQSVSGVFDDIQSGMGKEAEAEENALIGVSPPVLAFGEMMKDNLDEDALNTLRTMGKLEIAEYRYINRIAKTLKYSQVGKYCVAEIAVLKEQARGENDDE